MNQNPKHGLNSPGFSSAILIKDGVSATLVKKSNFDIYKHHKEQGCVDVVVVCEGRYIQNLTIFKIVLTILQKIFYVCFTFYAATLYYNSAIFSTTVPYLYYFIIFILVVITHLCY